jgi:hypothetical protein
MDSWGKKGKEEKKEDCHVISHSMSLSLSLSAPPEGKGGGTGKRETCVY